MKIIAPKLIDGPNGKKWLRPGISYIQQKMLNLSHDNLIQMAEKGETIEIPDEKWEKIKNAKIEWKPFKDGTTEGVKVSWKMEK